VREDEEPAAGAAEAACPYPFSNAAELLARARESGLAIGELVRANETATRPLSDLDADLDAVIGAMFASLDRGLKREGPLPGALKIKRRAKAIHEQLLAEAGRNARAAHEIMDTVAVYAMAVNEENAAGGCVVTAPTNGAAGLAAALGGANAQIENAAEIAMEHHLGMTCDPVGGLVQIPCIERNAFGAIKAIAAASLALRGDGRHKVSLDSVIATVRQTGADMQSKYKETSLGGLAVNFVEC
jgi:L-serine dehydratase